MKYNFWTSIFLTTAVLIIINLILLTFAWLFHLNTTNLLLVFDSLANAIIILTIPNILFGFRKPK